MKYARAERPSVDRRVVEQPMDAPLFAIAGEDVSQPQARCEYPQTEGRNRHQSQRLLEFVSCGGPGRQHSRLLAATKLTR